MLRRAVKDTVEVLVRIPAGTWDLKADMNALEIALINLAVNASDAMSEGGRVVVTARNAGLSKSAESSAGLDGQFVALSVSDTGVGIPAENLGHIFEPFFTTKPMGKGTGLGLSQVHGFAMQSGGAVIAESKQGEGTTITIYLPRSETAPAVAESRGPLPTQGRGRILLVEDNTDVAEVTSHMLADAGYEVTRAVDAGAALDLLSKSNRYDVILSDIVLENGISGIDLAQRIRRNGFAGRLVLMTGYSAAIEDARALNFPVIFKPFSQRELVEMLRQFERPASSRS